MKKIFSLLTMALLVLSVMPAVFAVDVGSSIGVEIITEDFAPKVWMCGDRIVMDDNIEWGRVSNPGDKLIERLNNYAFTGEIIQWRVLVMDKNGFEKIRDVYATIGSDQGEGQEIEVDCVFDELLDSPDDIDDNCNAKIGQANLEDVFSKRTAAYYTCTLRVESTWEGEYWTTVEAEDHDDLLGTMDENEYWFFNPVIALTIDGDLVFEDVRMGTLSYSDTILVGNDAEDGSGVMLDMFIAGTDFEDSASSGAMCPTSNVLALTNFAYFATSGAYSSLTDGRRDVEGYVGIGYGDHFDRTMYGINEILQGAPMPGGYWRGNILSPGSEIALTFRLDLPEPCNGDFDTGSIYFWGEAI